MATLILEEVYSSVCSIQKERNVSMIKGKVNQYYMYKYTNQNRENIKKMS